MTWEMDDAVRARLTAWPDDRFPDFRESEGGALLVELPKCGNGLHVLCCGCWKDRWIGGEEICRRWPAWLLRSQLDWARALRCDACGARRVALHAAVDPGAAGFQNGPEDTAPIVCARRMTAWLGASGVSLDEVIDHLADMPTKRALVEAGL